MSDRAGDSIWAAPRDDDDRTDVFFGFIKAHYQACGAIANIPDPYQPENWPQYEIWRECFVGKWLDPEDVRAAAKRVARSPPKPWAHLTALLDYAAEAKRARVEAEEKAARAATEDDEFEAARARWESLTESQRDTRRRLVAQAHPTLRRWKHFIEVLAIGSLIPKPNRRGGAA